jgi:voltage-gated potassium channel
VEAESPLFARCTADERRAVMRAATGRRVPAGTIVVREGEPGDEFFVIVDGLAAVRHGDEFVHVLGPGDFFGELALIDGLDRTATVEAATDLQLLVIGAAHFNALFDNIANFRAPILRAAGNMVRRTDERRELA